MDFREYIIYARRWAIIYITSVTIGLVFLVSLFIFHTIIRQYTWSFIFAALLIILGIYSKQRSIRALFSDYHFRPSPIFGATISILLVTLMVVPMIYHENKSPSKNHY